MKVTVLTEAYSPNKLNAKLVNQAMLENPQYSQRANYVFDDIAKYADNATAYEFLKNLFDFLNPYENRDSELLSRGFKMNVKTDAEMWSDMIDFEITKSNAKQFLNKIEFTSTRPDKESVAILQCVPSKLLQKIIER